jgi:cyclase
MGSNVTQWLAALDRIAQLDVDWVVPGHGPVVTPDYLARQRANLVDWVQAVADAVASGWSRDETVAKVNFAERYPVDVGQGYMMNHIQTLNAGSIWDKLTAGRPA